MGRVLAHTKAWQQLARIEAGLRKPQPRRTGDRSSIVAAIVRQPGVRPVASAGDEGLDLLFILRGGSTDPNQGSRWSGQVGFPGGHVEEHETDLEAVSRECREELGIRDLAGAGYRPLGRIADRSVYRTEKQSSLLVRCYVFEQLVHEDLTPDPAEVSACGWAPLRSLLSDQLVQPLPTIAGGTGMWSGYPSVLLPVRDEDMSLSVGGPFNKCEARKRFALWGLTLSMVNDWLSACELRDVPIALPPPSRAETRTTSHRSTSRM